MLKNALYPYNEIPFSNRKECTMDTGNQMNEYKTHYVDQMRSELRLLIVPGWCDSEVECQPRS